MVFLAALAPADGHRHLVTHGGHPGRCDVGRRAVHADARPLSRHGANLAHGRHAPTARYQTWPEPVAVTVRITGAAFPVMGSFPAVAYGWRGDRIYCQVKTGPAEKRLGWFDAPDVQRAP